MWWSSLNNQPLHWAGLIRRPISVSSDLAQRYSDLGIALYYGFNQDAVLHTFAHTAKLDSSCAMAWFDYLHTSV